MTRKRLDQILIEKGVVSDKEVRESLLRQRAHGGRFGSQLLYQRHLNEAQLVEALSVQMNAPGVVISGLEIPEHVVKMVPAKVAIARRVMPFEYDAKGCALKVACVDPTDSSLVNELRFVASGASIELHVAAEIALNTAIAKHYLGQDISLEDRLLVEIPDEATVTGTGLEAAGDVCGESGRPVPGILLVTDEEYAAGAIQSVLEREGHGVTIADSDRAAIDAAAEKRFATMIIGESAGTNSNELADRLRKLQPGAKIRLCLALPSLLLEEIPPSSQSLCLKNLELLVSLVGTHSGQAANHSARVGEYVARLCRRLGISDADLLAITSAAYLHNVGAIYYGLEDTEDARQVLELSSRLLSALSFPDLIIKILEAGYAELPKATETTLPVDVLGGSILTVADLFCHATPQAERLSVDKFDAVKKRLRERAGTMFLPEVVEGFIGMVQEAVLSVESCPTVPQVMAICDDAVTRGTLELRLKNEGFLMITADRVSEAAHLFERQRPDILILATCGTPEETRALVTELTSRGLLAGDMPTFILTDDRCVSGLTDLLRQGVEDVIPIGRNLDLLMSKLHKIRARLPAARPEGDTGSGVGAHGRLSDMNLIDLLQALGPGLKTARLTVRNEDGARTLVMCLSGGKITFAELAHLRGPEAIYEGLEWDSGTWTVEPLTPDDLP